MRQVLSFIKEYDNYNIMSLLWEFGKVPLLFSYPPLHSTSYCIIILFCYVMKKN